MGAGVRGAVRRRPGQPRRAPVEAVRRVDHAAPGAAPGRRRAAPAARRRARLARRGVHDRDVGAGVPLPRRPPDRSHRRLQPALPEPDRRRRPPAHGGRARGRARLVLDRRREGRPVRRRVVGRLGREPAGGGRRRHGRDGPLRPGARGRRRCRGRPASRPASTARRSRTSCGRTASRCATSRRASASRRSAAGSPPAPAATTPRTTPTSTTSSSRCGCSRRRGWWESRRLPGSGAGPSPDRMVIGSEGILGVITEAWMRIQAAPDVPRHGRHRVPDVGGGHRRRPRRSCRRSCGRRTAGSSTRSRRRGRPGSTARRRWSSSASSRPSYSQRHAIGDAVDIARAAGGTIADEDIKVDDGRGEPTGRGGSVGAWRDAFIGVDAGRRHQPRPRRRHVRDGDHVGPLAERSTPTCASACRRALREVFGDDRRAVVPLHPRLPGRSGAVLHVVRDGPRRARS